jgi:hypothetical protein
MVSQHRPVRTLIAGEPEPDRRARIRRMVDAFELSHVVEVRGEPQAGTLPFLIAACDLGIVPASETPRFQEIGDLPQPMLEYPACRRPVVAAGVPGVPEVLRDEKEGLLYVPGEEESLADAMTSLLDQPTLRERLVEAAYDRVRWAFSSSARRRRIAEVYEMLVPGSQAYDAWNEAFELEPTGQVELPDEMMEPAESPQVASPVPPSDGTTLPPPVSSTHPPERFEHGPGEDEDQAPYPPTDTHPHAAALGEDDDRPETDETPAEHTRVDTTPGFPADPNAPGRDPSREPS